MSIRRLFEKSQSNIIQSVENFLWEIWTDLVDITSDIEDKDICKEEICVKISKVCRKIEENVE